jgi:thioredoxin reductase (NADPH)
MPDPILFVVDDEPAMLKCLAEALERRFGADYRVLTDPSPVAALARLEQAAGRGEEVALVIANLRTAEMPGLTWLGRARDLFPTASRCVLVGYGDSAGFAQVRRALALGQVETFLMRPCDNPEERLYPVVGEILSRWSRIARPRVPVLRIVGERWSQRCAEMRDLSERASIPYAFYAHDSAEGRRLLEEVGHTGALPAVIFGGNVLSNPTDREIAEKLGARTEPEADLYDLIVIGAGPAGLATAVHAASDGLKTLVVERQTVGGQAGTSSMIRNYFGFPRGISGAQLAGHAHEQAISLGAEFIVTRGVTGLNEDESEKVVTLAGDRKVRAKAVVIATGVSYNRLGVEGVDALVGKGVFYGAATAEAPAFTGQEVFVVGAGNSAGQAAVHLARYAAGVTILVRGGALTMSDYLVRQIRRTGNITIRFNTQVIRAEGGSRLEALTIKETPSGKTERMTAGALFVLIGAGPHTAWLQDILQRDEQGYIRTGRHVVRGIGGCPEWLEDRMPHTLETSMPGVFAVGDVRHRSLRGVTAAVADGAVAISSVREYLAADS